MKKYLFLTIVILSVFILVSCVSNATPEPNMSDIATVAVKTNSNAETTAPDTTVTELDTKVTVPEITEPETTEITEPEVTEPDTSEAVTVPTSNEALIGTYICDSEQFKTDTFKNYSHYIPALTLNSDGSMIWRVYYIGGVVDIEGTYVVEENKIYIDCILEGTPVHGIDSSGYPYMDDKFVFEIEDDNTLVYYDHPDAKRTSCYAVNSGDKFVRE